MISDVVLCLPVPSVMVRSDTDVLKSMPPYSRSLSAPSDMVGTLDDSIIEIIKLQRSESGNFVVYLLYF